MIDANFLSSTYDKNVLSPAATATKAQFTKPCTEESVPETDDSSTASLNKSPTSPISDHSLVDVTSKK